MERWYALGREFFSPDGYPDQCQQRDMMFLEIDADEFKGPGDMALDGEGGKFHFSGDLGVAHAGHAAKHKRMVEL